MKWLEEPWLTEHSICRALVSASGGIDDARSTSRDRRRQGQPSTRSSSCQADVSGRSRAVSALAGRGVMGRTAPGASGRYAARWSGADQGGILLDMAKGGRLQRSLEKYLFNPLMRLGLRLGIAPRAFALLETTGRRSGLPRFTPVGNGLDGSTFWIVSEHGLRCDYVKNLVANPMVKVKIGRSWRSGTASLVDGDDPLARRRKIEGNGLIGRADGVIFRASARQPVTVRIALD